PDHGGRLRHQLRQGRPDPLLLDPGHEGRGSGGARLQPRRGGEGAGAPRVDPLEAPPPDGGGDVADGDRRVLPAAGRLLMHAKHPRESETVMSELMMPQHANIMGNVFGGVVLALVDRVAAVAAIRHAGKPCVTVSVDKVDFREPIHVGELLTAYTRVNFAGRTSMEVGVKIIAENVLTGEKRHTNSCSVTHVAPSAKGRSRSSRASSPQTCSSPTACVARSSGSYRRRGSRRCRLPSRSRPLTWIQVSCCCSARAVASTCHCTTRCMPRAPCRSTFRRRGSMVVGSPTGACAPCSASRQPRASPPTWSWPSTWGPASTNPFPGLPPPFPAFHRPWSAPTAKPSAS